MEIISAWNAPHPLFWLVATIAGVFLVVAILASMKKTDWESPLGYVAILCYVFAGFVLIIAITFLAFNSYQEIKITIPYEQMMEQISKLDYNIISYEKNILTIIQ